MKILVFGDLQATEGHERAFHNPALSLQRWRVQKFYRDALELYNQERCDAVWDLGDTTDDRNAIPITTIDSVVKGFSAFRRHALNVKLIGNHEQYIRSTTLHAGRLFSSVFRVVDGVEEFAGPDGTIIIACAFPESDASLADWLTKTLKKHRGKRVIMLGHFQIAGCQLNSGLSLTGVPKKSLEGVTLGLLGHVHKFQEVDKNIFYVGSPFQQDFGEAGEQKYVGVVDTSQLTVDWYSLPGFPEYHVVDFKNFTKMVREESEDRLRVVLHSHDEAEAFYAHPLSVRAEPVYDYTRNEPGQRGEDHGGGHSVPDWTRDLRGSLKAYLDHVKPDGIPLERDELLQIGLDIADSADPKGD